MLEGPNTAYSPKLLERYGEQSWEIEDLMNDVLNHSKG